MEIEIPKSEVIDKIFKDKTTDRKNLITGTQKNNVNIENKKNENIQNNDNDLSPINASNKDRFEKRRQGLWLNKINLMQKENEKEETPSPIIQEEIKEEVKVKRKRDKIIKAYNFLTEFVSSQIGCFIMLIIILFILCYYDLKMIVFSNKYKYLYNGCYVIFLIYSSIDFVIRTIIIENLIKSLYFWIDLLSLVIIIFDFDSLSYPLLHKILNYHHPKSKYISYHDQGRIEILLNVFQIVKLFRVVKFYKLFVDLIKEKEKKSNIMKILEKINEKKNKTNKNKLIKHIRATFVQMKEFNNTTTMPLAVTPVNHGFEPKTPNLKKINERTSIITSSLSQDNRKWEEDAIKYLEEHIFKKNKISQKITEGISRLMIVIVLLVFIVSIFTDEDNYGSDYFSYKIICKLINRLVKDKKMLNENDVSRFVKNYLLTNKLILYPIIQVEWNEKIVYQNKSMNLYLNEYMRRDICYIFDINDPSTVIIISRRVMSKMSSVIYLCRLFYIIICISSLCYLININVYDLIFHPLEKIGKVIDIISKDPVGSETITELKNSMENKETNKKEDKNSVSHEIKIIQSAIIRISALMAIGFGEAGGEILKENISSSEGINPMLRGKKISAIFGFCFIHNFSEINEAFQERTMIFVNQISDIVHSCVDKFNGITNKNLGDCYLLAWKFKEKTDKKVNEENYTNNNLNTNEIKISVLNESNMSNKNEELADCALLGFLNIIKKINKNRNILAYRKDSDLLKKFGPKYSVQMGFGLHTGWGIEGAIGSYYKIDCSYLSPNVNIAARLETATNIYGVDILFSGEFYDLLSDFMKRLCRKIDVVTLKGSEKPVRLYTVDINKNIHPGKIMSKKDRMTLRERRSYYALKKKKLWHKFQKLKSESSSIGEIYLKQSKGLRQLLKKTKSDIFYQYFEDGFGDYIDGEWKDAAQNLEKARYLDKSDGPTKTILDYIKKLDYKAPSNWDGYRVLTSKT